MTDATLGLLEQCPHPAFVRATVLVKKAAAWRTPEQLAHDWNAFRNHARKIGLHRVDWSLAFLSHLRREETWKERRRERR